MRVGRQNETNRREWVRHALSRLPRGARLLDAGAGEQQYRQFCGHLDYVSQDFGRYDPGVEDVGLQWDSWEYPPLDIVSDICEIPEPDGAFDAVLCTEVLEHVPQPVRAVGELARVLKEGGVLLLTAPFASYTHFAPYHFATGFNRYWYEIHLASLGLEIDEMTPNGSFFEAVAQEIWRTPKMMEKYTRRRFPHRYKPTLFLALRILQRLAEEDRGSHEFCCHGYHVRALKRPGPR